MAVLMKSRKALEQKKSSHRQSLSSPPEGGGGVLVSRETPTEGFLPTTFTKNHSKAQAGWMSGCMEAKDTKQGGHLVGRPRASAPLTKGSDPK